MPSWKKIIQSGSDAHLSTVTASTMRISSIEFDDGLVTSAAELGGGQNVFTTISSSGEGATGSFSADTITDTINFSAGNNIHISASNDTIFISSSGGISETSYNGNRRVLNPNLPQLFANNFNPNTTGSIEDFLDAVFYPNTAPQFSSSQFLKVDLSGDVSSDYYNAKVTLFYNDEIQFQEYSPSRGFMSSVEHSLHFGFSKNVELL